MASENGRTGTRTDGGSGSKSSPQATQTPTKHEIVEQWSRAFGRVGGPLSMLICFSLVLTFRPSPGRLLPLSWDVGIIVGTFLCIAASYGLGALFGYVAWLATSRARCASSCRCYGEEPNLSDQESSHPASECNEVEGQLSRLEMDREDAGEEEYAERRAWLTTGQISCSSCGQTFYGTVHEDGSCPLCGGCIKLEASSP